MSIDNGLDLLVAEHVKTTLQAIITTLGLWMRKHDVDVSDAQTAQNVINEFEEVTEEIIASGQYQRRQRPQFQALPKFNWTRVDSLSEEVFLSKMQDMRFGDGLKFMGQLTGAWILACPEIIIRDMGGIQISPNSTETELILIMRKALHYSLL